MLDSDLSWRKELWKVEAGVLSSNDFMCSVSIDGDVCVLCSFHGKVFVLKLIS